MSTCTSQVHEVEIVVFCANCEDDPFGSFAAWAEHVARYHAGDRIHDPDIQEYA